MRTLGRLSPLLGLFLTALLAAPAPALAQAEGETPETLVVSQWKCDYQHLEEVQAEVDELLLPVWQGLVDEGRLVDVGAFYHEWGDAWNFGVYYVAEDKTAFFDAWERFAQRAEEAAPEGQEPAVFEHCTEHRDNIYRIGSSTQAPSGGS